MKALNNVYTFSYKVTQALIGSVIVGNAIITQGLYPIQNGWIIL